MTRFLSCTRLRLVAALLFVGASALDAQTIITFDVPNSTSTSPQAINWIGEITGYYNDASGGHGFLRHVDGTTVTFDPPFTGSPIQATVPLSINSQGEIAGYFVDAFAFFRGFLRHTDGTFTIFESPTTASTAVNPKRSPAGSNSGDFFDGIAARAINLEGQTTGAYGGAPLGGSERGFLRQANGTFIGFDAAQNLSGFIPVTEPEDINALGQITGHYYDASGIHGFLRQPDGAIIRFDPRTSTANKVTFPQAINLEGYITGYYSDAKGTHGFLRRTNGTIVKFDPQGSSLTQANSINFFGQIAGFYLDADSTYHGFLRNWNQTITSFDAPGAGIGNSTGTFPQGINLFGEITGYYQDTNLVTHGFVRRP